MKYFSKTTMCNQMHKHASQKEAKRCDELTILEKAGLIKNLKQQPEFPLQEKFEFLGHTVRPITYRADFSYIDNKKKKFVIEDTKGYKTTDYKIKIKMLKSIMKEREDFLFIES